MRNEITSQTLEKFKTDNKIPSWVKIEIPSPEERGKDSSAGHFIPNYFITDCGLTIPPNPFFIEVCSYFQISPSVMTANTCRTLNGIHRLNVLHGTKIGVSEVLYCYDWIFTKGTGLNNLRAKNNRNLVLLMPDSNKDANVHGLIYKDWQYEPQNPEVGPEIPLGQGKIGNSKKTLPRFAAIRKSDLRTLFRLSELVDGKHPRSAEYLLKVRITSQSLVCRIPETTPEVSSDHSTNVQMGKKQKASRSLIPSRPVEKKSATADSAAVAPLGEIPTPNVIHIGDNSPVQAAATTADVSDVSGRRRAKRPRDFDSDEDELVQLKTAVSKIGLEADPASSYAELKTRARESLVTYLADYAAVAEAERREIKRLQSEHAASVAEAQKLCDRAKQAYESFKTKTRLALIEADRAKLSAEKMASDAVAEVNWLKHKVEAAADYAFDNGWDEAEKALAEEVAFLAQVNFKKGWDAALTALTVPEVDPLWQLHVVGEPPEKKSGDYDTVDHAKVEASLPELCLSPPLTFTPIGVSVEEMRKASASIRQEVGLAERQATAEASTSNPTPEQRAAEMERAAKGKV